MSIDADTLVFVYGENPAIDELDPADKELVIVTRHAAQPMPAGLGESMQTSVDNRGQNCLRTTVAKFEI